MRNPKIRRNVKNALRSAISLMLALMLMSTMVFAADDTAAETTEGTKEALSSVSIGGISYYYTNTTDDAADTVYVATVRGRGGETEYTFAKSDLTQVGETGYSFVTLSGVTPLSGTLYAYVGGTTSTYKEVYADLGAEADDTYDAVSSATNFTSFHAGDISSVVNYGTDDAGNKVINGVNLGRTYTTVDADVYVEASILNAAGETLTDEQKAALALNLKQNPTAAPASENVTPVAATATWTTSKYGVGEFVINPDDTVEGYTWSEYWDNTYAVTISDGTTTVGAVHWIDVYGEKCTSGGHYNKLEIALNNGTSVGANAAEVNRYAAFFDANTNNLKPGTYTITVYAEGYDPMVATVEVPEEALQSASIGGVTYFYGDTTDDAANTVYTATVASRRESVVYNFTKADMTQVGETGYYYVTATNVTPLSGTVYAVNNGKATNYKEVYTNLGVAVDDTYDAVSSATNFTSFHAGDISSVVTYTTDDEGNKAITGLDLERTYTAVDAAAYVEANVLKAAGVELTAEQETLTTLTLKQNANNLNAEAVTPVAATATWETSKYGVGEFVINPDDTVEGYNWSEYWDNIYAVTISNGATTVGAVHWIDVYGEKSTSGGHYNKLEIALNNGTSVGSNAAEVTRYAAFFNEDNTLKAGKYTITVYADGYEPMTAVVAVRAEDLQSATIGGVSYYYTDTTDDAADTVYYATVRGRGGNTEYTFAKSDMTQVGDTGYYYVTLNSATPLEGTLYAFESGTATTYAEVYKKLGVSTDASYDAVSSATTFSSFHAGDIASVVTYGTDAAGNKAITGLNTGRTYTTVDATTYVEANILKAAGAELTAEQEAAAALTLKQNPTEAPNTETVTPAVASATWETSRYGVGEFVIVPDETVAGYKWNEFWDNTYAVTISNGTKTVGAVHWIDVYGEKCTSGYHYNKLEIALNNGTSVASNAAEVNRFAAFFNADNTLKDGRYTITVYADGYAPLVATVDVGTTVTLAAKTATYTGKTISINKAVVTGSTGAVTYKYYSDSKCTKTVKSHINAGTYYVTATVAATDTTPSVTSSPVKLTIKKASQSIKVYTSTKTVYYSKVKKAKQTVRPITKVTGAKTTVYYKKISGSSKLTIGSSTGKVYVKKGTKKGTYSIKVRVYAKYNTNYTSSAYVYKTLKVRVK